MSRLPIRFRLLVPAIFLAFLPGISPTAGFAQSSQGWLRDSVAEAPIPQVVGMSGSVQTLTVGNAPSVPPPGQGAAASAFGGTSSAPDELTPEIAALTLGVINGRGSLSAWQKCFLFVTNQIEYEHYHGCKKGALLTYLERKDNDADLATLLVAMLRSAGYTARYGYGMVAIRAANDPDGVHIQN